MTENHPNTITTTGQLQDLIKKEENFLAVFILKGLG